MSCNRENETWQSADGTWNRGFYAYYDVGCDREDWDHEWDVEYEDYFWWVSTGLPSEDAAWQVWDGANPGTTNIWAWSEKSADQCARFDEMAAAVKATGNRDRFNRYGQVWTRR